MGACTRVLGPHLLNLCRRLTDSAPTRHRPILAEHRIRIDPARILDGTLEICIGWLVGRDGRVPLVAPVSALHVIDLSMEVPRINLTDVGLYVNPSSQDFVDRVPPNSLHIMSVVVRNRGTDVETDKHAIGQIWACDDQIGAPKCGVPAEVPIGQTDHCQGLVRIVWIPRVGLLNNFP